MERNLNSSSLVPPRRLGSALQATRAVRGTSLEMLAGASQQRFSATDLLDIEAGRRQLPDEEFAAVVSLYEMPNLPVFPPRVRLVIDSDSLTLAAGAESMPLSMTERDHVLERYVALLYHLREEPVGTKLALRRADIDVLSESFIVSPADIRFEIEAIMVGATMQDATISLAKRFLVPTVGVLVGVASVGAIVMVPALQAGAQASGPLPEFVESDAVRSVGLSPAATFTESDGGAAFWTGVFDAAAPAAPLGVIDDSGNSGTSIDDPDVMTDVVTDDGEPGDGGGETGTDDPFITDVVTDDEVDPGEGSGGSETGQNGIEDSGEGLVPNDGGAGSGEVGDPGTGIEDSGEGLVPNDGGAGSGEVGDPGTGIEDSGEGLVPNDGGAGSGDIGVEDGEVESSAQSTTIGAFFLRAGDVSLPESALATAEAPLMFVAGDDSLPSGTDVTADSIEVLDGTADGGTWVSSLSLAGGGDLGTEALSAIGSSTADPRVDQAQSRITFDWQSLLPDWTVSFVEGDGSVRGETYVSTKAIVVYVSEVDTASSLAAVFAHELGHALDVSYLDTEERLAWLDARDLQTLWWPDAVSSDFSVGAGDYAEAIAMILADAPSYAAAGTFTPEQLALALSFIPDAE